ncbi:type IV secretion system protein VirB10 [Paraburkholderia sp. GAS33]|uniref:type IV secretion system protein VirB10 n=1 Tax=Paraburkholderia sp. GAS33 TaxID=3035130 RepID=UPI003D1AC654
MNSIDPKDGVPEAGVGERGVPGLVRAKRKTNVRKLWIVAVVFVFLAFGALGAAVFIKRLGDEHLKERADARNAPKASGMDTGHDFAADAAALERQRKEQERQAAIAAATSAAAAPPAPGGAGGANGPIAVQPVGGRTGSYAAGGGPAVKAPETAAERRLEGAVLVPTSGSDGDGERATPAEGGAAGTAGAAKLSSAPGTAAGAGGLDDRLAPSKLASVKAGWLPDLDYLLKRGTIIPCGQKTKIVTTYPGMTSCIVSKDVYSADGKTLLIERGSEATGEQRTALLQGQARIFVLWSRIDMPDGVKIDLDSPGTDSLGASGLDAYVDTHFWERFGGALMMSVVSDLGQALSNLTVGGGTSQVQLSSTSSSTQDLASETLKNTINIPPTAYSNQGSEINIFVARDVDARSVYELANQ